MIRLTMDGSSPLIASAPQVERTVDAPPHDDLFCPGCGYDLRSIASDRCPECGLPIDRDAGVSRIPWAHRRRIGWARAYWRTVWLATFNTRKLAAEIERPVDYRVAQHFRLVTALLAALAIVSVFVTTLVAAGGMAELATEFSIGMDPYDNPPRRAGRYDMLLPWAAGVMVVPVLPAATLVFFVLATGVASYWFHPRSLPVVRQNRAVALSCYASAPLLFVWLPALNTCLLIALAAQGQSGSRPYILLFFLNIFLVPIVVLAFYVSTLRLMRTTTGARRLRTVLAAILIPISWVLSGLLAMFGIPWVVGFAWLVFDSMR